jgi:hypothetical protein
MIGRRVQRGFRRLGLLVAVPLLVVAAVILTVAGVQAITAPHETEYPTFPHISGCDHLLATAARDQCQKTLYRDDIEKYDRERAAWRESQQPWETLSYAIAFAAAALAWYAACWAIGWVLAGFARDDDVTVEPPQ